MEKAKILERLIKEQGYNLKSFAEKCGIPYTTLYGIIKNGVGRATMDNIMTICRYLGIKVEDLERMAEGKAEETQPSYSDLITVYTRSKKNLSQEEKMRLARIILEDDED
ncbi:helix-turn-helix domain-containing protein [Lachnoclostridium phytofermentans]|uniref:helix-turn-helix domain-containing protein n=1 Tax=Lachnoclostridium phytofermentans TaxID=66219 RepID=UPI0004950B68|nr:helix-turn-helix transcriptional regulator [Lachnoclostridium phytofermentans]